MHFSWVCREPGTIVLSTWIVSSTGVKTNVPIEMSTQPKSRGHHWYFRKITSKELMAFMAPSRSLGTRTLNGTICSCQDIQLSDLIAVPVCSDSTKHGPPVKTNKQNLWIFQRQSKLISIYFICLGFSYLFCYLFNFNPLQSLEVPGLQFFLFWKHIDLKYQSQLSCGCLQKFFFLYKTLVKTIY